MNPLCALLLVLISAARAGDTGPTFTAHVPMRDGVELATDIYLPAPDGPALPAILIRTPYGRERYEREYGSWTRWGYAVAIQDTRRRSPAGEEALAFVDDGWGANQDGADTVSWLSRQGFCNGSIGTMGASAMGITQYLLAPAAPDNLVCQYILVGASSLYHHAAYPGGQLAKSMVEEWLRGNRYDASVTVTREHPCYDDHWRGLDSKQVAGRVRAAAIHYGGWFDCFLEGTIAGYTSRVEKAPGEVARNQKLLIGPWLHGGPNDVTIGDFTLPPNARRDPPGHSARRWMDCWLKGTDGGPRALPPVTYYAMGPFDGSGPGNEWRTSSTWPPASQPVTFYLHRDRSLRSEAPRDDAASLSFTADPCDPVPTIGGANLVLKERGPMDQRPIEGRPDVLVFSTDPLPEQLDVAGTVKAILWLTTNVCDTDLAVRLTDVYPGGRSILICDGIRRAALRSTFEKPLPLEPGVPTLITVDVGTTSIVFAPGHRLRIIVAGSNYPRLEANTNAAWQPSKDPIAARNAILLSARHPSCLVVPVLGSGKR